MSWVDRRLLTLGVQLVTTWMITKTWGEFLSVWAIIVAIQVVCGVLYLLFACIGHRNEPSAAPKLLNEFGR
jgi:hypothetical protein